MVSDVVRRIGEPPRRPAIGRVPRLAGASLALVVVAVVALPGPRHAVARWLGFDSVRIEPGVTVPSDTHRIDDNFCRRQRCPPGLSSSRTTLLVPDLGLGPPLSIEQAKSATGLPDPTPALLGHPQSIHVVQPPATGQIVLVYPPSAVVPESPVIGAGALVSVMPAHIEEGFFQKTLGSTSTVRSGQRRWQRRLLDRRIAAPVDVRFRRPNSTGHAAAGHQHLAVAARRLRLSHRSRCRSRNRHYELPHRSRSAVRRSPPATRLRRRGWRRPT